MQQGRVAPGASARGRLSTVTLPRLARDRLFGFAALHLVNTALNIGFTLLQLLVLAHILALSRYSQIVFLSTIGFYVQPLNQACGKTAFVALRSSVVRGRPAEPRVEVTAALALQGVIVSVLVLTVPSFLAAPGSQVWIEDALFLFLSLAVNAWAFDLQSTAWAVGLNLSFVRLSIVHRALHVVALGAGLATGSLLMFVLPATCATLICGAVALRMFTRVRLLGIGSASPGAWRQYGGLFRSALFSTAADFLVLNAPYVLLTARFGIGPTLIVFDSVMKVARLAMAGARTLGEIALPRHSALMEGDQAGKARRLFWSTVALCVGASAIPALIISVAGTRVFHLLLGANDVVDPRAMLPAALVILASGLYQSTSFFIGYGGDRRASLAMVGSSLAALLLFLGSTYLFAGSPSSMLSAFGMAVLGVGSVAATLVDRSFDPRFRVEPPARVDAARARS